MNDALDIDRKLDEYAKNRKKQLQINAKQNDDDLIFVMSSPSGRNAIWNILSIRGPYSTSFASNPIDMAFNEGNRNFSCRILDELMRVCPELYLLAQQEAINKEKGLENGNK